MHDWTLLSTAFDWKNGQVTLEFRKAGPALVSVVANGVSDIHVPQLNEWGPSVSVNTVEGTSDCGNGQQRLAIEMQSGDVITIVAASFILPLPVYF